MLIKTAGKSEGKVEPLPLNALGKRRLFSLYEKIFQQDDPDLESDLEKALKDPNRGADFDVYLLIEKFRGDDRGFALGYNFRDVSRSDLEYVGVLPEFRKQGVGGKLTERFVDYSKSQYNPKGVFLDVAETPRYGMLPEGKLAFFGGHRFKLVEGTRLAVPDEPDLNTQIPSHLLYRPTGRQRLTPDVLEAYVDLLMRHRYRLLPGAADFYTAQTMKPVGDELKLANPV